jgi:glycosyltransferase involved in cell wall biosynthesis
VQRGHVVEAWCPPTADRTYLPLSDLVPEHVVPFEWEPASEGSRIGRLMAPYRNIRRKLRAMDLHCRQCAAQINQGGYDLLFANASAFFHTTAIGRHVRLPSVLYLQEPYRALYEAMPVLPWLAIADPPGERWSIGYLRRFVKDLVQVQALRIQAREEVFHARDYDVILANSFFSRESILRAYGIVAKVCYLGIDTNLFVNLHRPRERFVAGLGSVAPHKSMGLVLAAIGQLPAPRPDLVWIGNVANELYLQEMRQLAESLGVRLTVKVGIPDAQVVDILNRAAVLVYAPRLEPFGFAPLEANACGLPVVAVSEGGVRETIRDGVNGLLVDDDPSAIARAVERILTDHAYAARLGTDAEELVRREWSLDASIDRLEARLTEARFPELP